MDKDWLMQSIPFDFLHWIWTQGSLNSLIMSW